MMRRVWRPLRLAAIALALCAALPASSDAGDKSGAAVATPIIAELFSRPQEFVDKAVKIYGLVVEASHAGQRFLLQDVSQMPLRVVAPEGDIVAAGSQLMVYGIVRRVGGGLELEAENLLPVQVVAGGGCC